MEKDSSSWISHVTSLIEPERANPMWEGVEQVEWDQLSSAIGEALDSGDCHIEARGADWKREGDILSGLGQRPISTPITLSPISEPLYWVMPAEDAKHLARVSKEGTETFVDPEIQKSFYRYLILNALDASSKLQFLGDLSPKLGESTLPSEPAYCVDINIAMDGQSVWGRLVCPQSFHAGFIKHQSGVKPLPIDMARAANIPLSLSLRVGHTDLSLDEWRSVKEGDFIALDHCTYSPKKHKGTVSLTLNETPLLMLKVREGKLKIFDYLFTSREEMRMDDSLPPLPMEEEVMEEEEHEVAVESEAPEEIVNPKAVPLTIQVEVARLKMSLDELLKLKPGNALALSVKPQEGVTLVLNGKAVGKGELYQLGETLGVKVTQTV